MTTRRTQKSLTTRTARFLMFTLPVFAVVSPACSAEVKHAEHKAKESAPGHSHANSEMHGGAVTMTPHHHFETIFTSKEVRLWIYDAKQAPVVDPESAKAVVSLERKQGAPTRLEATYVAPDPALGRAQGYFTAAYDFSTIPAGEMKALFRIEGAGEIPEEFRAPVIVTEAAVYACPMHPDVQGTDPVPCLKCGMALERTAPSKPSPTGGHNHEPGSGHTH